MSKVLRNRVKGFTLTEMLVSSVLTLILISVAYYSYTFLVKNFVAYEEINEKIGEHCRLQMYMENLMQKSNAVFRTRQGISFRKGDEEIKNLVLTNEYLVFNGNNNVSDTLYMKLNRSVFKWKEDSALADGLPIQAIELSVELSKKEYSFNFEKMYDSERLIRLDSIYKSLR